jgi:fermentation-respiration switch protein FrsA (DUF1100 family)
MLTPVLGIIAAVVLLMVLVRLVEPRMAFLPTTGESVTPRELGLEYESLMIATRDGQRLHGWSLTRPAARARILYFHGNGGNLSLWAQILAGIVAKGYTLVAFDYRGYGLSNGRPSERGLYTDVDAIVEYFWRDSAPLPVVYWGRSLGVAMASYAATVRRPDALILESGFPDVRSLIRESPVLSLFALFSSYRFPATTFLRRLDPSVPILVVHGDRDQVVPIAQGRKLFDAVIATAKRFISIRGGDHNDVFPADSERYWRAVEELVRGLARSGR